MVANARERPVSSICLGGWCARKIPIWINGAYLGGVTDSTYRGGLVGVGMYEIDAAASSFLVDSARLYYSATGPYELTGAQLGAPLNRVVTGEIE